MAVTQRVLRECESIEENGGLSRERKEKGRITKKKKKRIREKEKKSFFFFKLVVSNIFKSSLRKRF